MRSLAGFVAVIMVLVLTPGFFPERGNLILQAVSILFSISIFGYLMDALLFLNISTTPHWRYESLAAMKKDFAFSQALLVLCTVVFLTGVTAMNFYLGAPYVAAVTFLGLLFVSYELIKDWWALARRTPPKKKAKGKTVHE